ncbi:MAG: hypothetical protein PHE55_18160, partial [Methylococcaceae bacterium]|nr:hypothetical protein [Methylococcaceae bacterium]
MKIRYFPSQEPGAMALLRRGFEYGWIKIETDVNMPAAAEVKQAWLNDQAILLPRLLTDVLPRFEADIVQAHELFEQLLDGAGLSERLESKAYAERLLPDFG